MDNDRTFSFPLDHQKLMRAMSAQDDIGALLRVHYELDRALQYVLEKKMPNPSALKLRYTGQYIGALAAIGASDHVLAPVRAINQVRNSFAHKGQEFLSDADVTTLQTPVEKLIDKSPFPQNWSVEFDSKGFSPRRWIFKDMNAKERFCTLAFITIAVTAALAEPEA